MKTIAAGGQLRLLSYLFIDLKTHCTRILEVTVEFKAYIKAAVIVFVKNYPPHKQSHIRIRDSRYVCKKPFFSSYYKGNNYIIANTAFSVENLLYLRYNMHKNNSLNRQ